MAFARNLPYVSRSFLRKGIFERLKKRPTVFNKSTRISLDFAIDRKINIYNGMRHVSIFLRSSMAGHAFGQFCMTKRQGSEIHNTTKKTKKKGRK